MSTINYLNIYSLNFSKINDFKSLVNSFGNDLQPKFQAAFRADLINEGITKGKSMLNFMSRALGENNEDTPGARAFSEIKTNIIQAGQNAQTILAQYGGADPYRVQALVSYVLGIEDIEQPVSDEVKKEYLLAMKSSGFLNTSYSPTNPLIYQPGPLAFQYLITHPEIKAMTIACGEAGKDTPGSCHFRRIEDHSTASFTIDLSAAMGPNVVVNMHDPNFWRSIPNERFEKILDHSYGYFLFDDQQSANTLQNLFRVLQPGGYLKMDHPFRENHIVMLRNAGFSVEEGQESSTARKLG
jgi:hypothetical protein